MMIMMTTTTTTNYIISVIVMMMVILFETSFSTTVDVCNLEPKSISCSGDDVIVIDSARYGRMTQSQCLRSTTDLNCSADVSLYLDHLCAGRRSCEVGIDKTLLNSTHRCGDLVTYLEFTYHCLPVLSPPRIDPHQCPGRRYFIEPTNSGGYLARIATIETGFGSTTCPWVIGVKSGQTIRLRIMDFGIWRTRKDLTGEGRPTCRVYFTVSDVTSSGQGSVVCGGSKVEDRERMVYTSNTNSVQLAGISSSPNHEYFLVKYEVLGCPDISPLPHSSIERNGDSLTIRCNEGVGGQGLEGQGQNDLETVLKCVDGNWTGPPSVNCSAIYQKATSSQKQKESSTFQGVLLTVVISAAVVIVVLVATVAIFVFWRHRLTKQGNAVIGVPLDDYHFGPATASYDQTWPSSLCTSTGTTTTVPMMTTGSTQGLRGLLQDSSRRPSAECLDQGTSTLQVRHPRAAPNLGHSASFSSFRQMPLGSCDGPYNGVNTMLMYCPYHGTITRVPGAAGQQRSGHNRVPVFHSHENIIAGQQQQHQQQEQRQFLQHDIYHELDFDSYPITPDSRC